MKKTLTFTIILLSIAFIANAQSNPVSFFGFHLGDTISLEALSSRLDNHIEYIEEGSGFIIEDVEYNGKQWKYALMHINNAYSLTGVSLIMVTEYKNATPIEQLLNDPDYIALKNSLGPEEKLLYDPMDIDPTMVQFVDESSLISSYIQFSDFDYNDISTKVLILGYWDLSLILEFSMDLYGKDKPVIQDTFLGIQLGSSPTLEQLKKTVGPRGVFFDYYPNPQSAEATFTDVYFAGDKWDYAEFCFTPTGKVYSFCVYDTYSTWDMDETERANRSFSHMKDRLDSKYGTEEVEQEEDGVSVLYAGKSGIFAKLSNTISLSSGGVKRRYVKLEYYSFSLLNEIVISANEEL